MSSAALSCPVQWPRCPSPIYLDNWHDLLGSHPDPQFASYIRLGCPTDSGLDSAGRGHPCSQHYRITPQLWPMHRFAWTILCWRLRPGGYSAKWKVAYDCRLVFPVEPHNTRMYPAGMLYNKYTMRVCSQARATPVENRGLVTPPHAISTPAGSRR
jgi:hypothetical protein